MSREDMDTILDEGIKVAIYLLEKNGEFYPFGVTKSPDGQIACVHGYTGVERPTSDCVSDLLVRGLRDGAAAGRYLTTAVVSDTRLRDRTTGLAEDAIRVELEDRDEHPVTCYLPYFVCDGRVQPGEVMAEAGKSIVFQ